MMSKFVSRASASFVLALGLLLAASTGVRAQSTVYVDDNTCPATGTGTVSNPYCKIQTAVCNHRNDAGGVIIRVKPGSYNEAVRMFPNVQVISTDGPDVTFIDPTGKPCFPSPCN